MSDKNLLARLCVGLLIVCAFLCVTFSAEAKQVTVEATGWYTIGDGPNESIAVAKERARVDAMRSAAEQGGVFVESISQVKDANLTKDEVNVITAQVMQVKSETMHPIIEGGCVKYVCDIVAVIDTDVIDLDKYIENKTALKENMRLQNEIERLKQENSSLKEQYKQATSSNEKSALAEQVKNNEIAFKKAVVEIPIAKDKFTTRTVDSSTIEYNQSTGILTFKIRETGVLTDTVRTVRVDVNKNSIQCLDLLDKSPITGKTTYRKSNDYPSPIWGDRFGTQEVVKIYQYLGIQPTNMYRSPDWRLVYTDSENTKYYIDIANSRYDRQRAFGSFPIKRYNENGLYEFLGMMKYTDENLFYYDYIFGKIGISDAEKINYTDPFIYNDLIVNACNQAKIICKNYGRNAFIWEQ